MPSFSTIFSKGLSSEILISLLVAITLCESRESSESNERNENRRERDGREMDSVDTDVGLCKGKRRNQLCDEGEGRCVWARRARRMICVEMNNGKDDDRESQED